MYWPNQRAMKLDVPEVATVGDSVRLALQAHKDRETGDSEAKVYHDHPGYYELRMYDEDEGEPEITKGKSKCDVCGKIISSKQMTNHKKACSKTAMPEEGGEKGKEGEAKVIWSKTKIVSILVQGGRRSGRALRRRSWLECGTWGRRRLGASLTPCSKG